VKKKVKKKKTQKETANRYTQHLLIGIILGVFLIFIALNIPDGSQVLGASTSPSSIPFLSSISSFFSQLLTKTSQTNSSTSENKTQVTLSQSELLAMADNKYADGTLPLGDNMYVTDAPKKGYIYLCSERSDENAGGAQAKGSWIYGNTWNIKEKISVTGQVSWPQATFSNTISGDKRTILGNDLPLHQTTGTFPIQSSDPAYAYDKNPNSIASQTIQQNFPTSPFYSDSAYCMGGEVGIMLNGVVLFNGFDATHRDAAAWEVQDSCSGHPQVSSEYHYHSLSSCITDISETTVIGFALDGFPITGPKVADSKYLTTEDLDECHGITSEITLDGKTVTMYHYVMTEDFPYSVSCFRGKPVSLMVTSQTNGMMQNRPSGMPSKGINLDSGHGTMMGSRNTMQKHQPPQEAISVCSGKTSGSSCSFNAPMGTVTGTCQTPQEQTTLMCVPAQKPQ
jgi:hypothetical protein